jgi:hypothetical protein
MLLAFHETLLNMVLLDTSIDPVVLLFYGPLLVMLVLGIVAFASLFAFGGVSRNGRAQLALALFLLLVGEAFFVAVQLWPGASSDNSFLDITIPGMWYLLIAGLVMTGGLSKAGVHVFITIVIFLLSLGAAIWPGHFISSINAPFLSEYIYGGVLFLLSLLTLIIRQRANLWNSISQPVLLGGGGAFLLIVLLLARGADDWRFIPYGADILLMSWIVGTSIFLIERRATQQEMAAPES